jgi:hypothetical protein
MAVGIRAKFDGGTQQQYDAINGHMGIVADPPQGMIFHSAGPIDGGWGVIDFWESREHFDRFARERIGPAVAAASAAVEPDIREFPVHERFPRNRKPLWQYRLLRAAVGRMEASSRAGFRAMRCGIDCLEKRGQRAKRNAPPSQDAAAAPEPPIVEVPPETET